MDCRDPKFKVSELFDVRMTHYGGRACFALQDMARGTDVLHVEKPLGSAICYEFRKEVCSNCFCYDLGKSMKVRAGSSWRKGAGLWFCSENCRDEFMNQSQVKHLVDAYEALLVHWELQSKRRANLVDNSEGTAILEDTVESAWTELKNNWISRVDRMKESKRRMQLPVLNEDEYICARFVIHCLFTLKTVASQDPLHSAFVSLQSNESEKIKQFPVLLRLQRNVFQTLYVLLPPFLKEELSIDIFRQILGSEYGNSFGIWQKSESSDSREYLGYCVLPEASYFNHSCAPNLDKHRIGRSTVFTLNCDVSKGQELCIDYKGILHLQVHERRRILEDNWFFSCSCARCLSELRETR